MLRLTISDATVGASIGATAALVAGFIERRALRSAGRRDRLQHAVTRLAVESVVIMGDLGVYGTAVFRRSIWYHVIGVPGVRRIQRHGLRVIAEARSDLALATQKKAILDAADELLEAVSRFVSIATAEHTPSEADLNRGVEVIAEARRSLLRAAGRTRTTTCRA